MSVLSTMWTCHWAWPRIQRCLDADPAAPPTAEQRQRLERQLATCEGCAPAAMDYQGLRLILATWSQRRRPDPMQLITEDVG